MSGPRALFVCDGSPSVGGGHVMRSLTLAQALSERGWRSTFLADGFVSSLMDRHDRVGCGRLAVADCAPGTLTEAAAKAAGFDAVIFDHFGMDARHEAGVSARLRVAVDDLADRPHAVDVLIDCNLQRTPADYRALAPGAELLLGPEYAPVREEFAAVRPASMARRLRRHEAGSLAGRALVSLGLTDVGGVTARVVRALLPWNMEAGLDVVVGRRSPSLPELEALLVEGACLDLHLDVDAARMAALMSAADVAVGAGGSSTWERAVVGLPSVTLVLADNQAPGAAALDRRGLAAAVDMREPGWRERLLHAVEQVTIDEPITISEALTDLCDGLGAGRTADRLTARVQSGARQ